MARFPGGAGGVAAGVALRFRSPARLCVVPGPDYGTSPWTKCGEYAIPTPPGPLDGGGRGPWRTGRYDSARHRTRYPARIDQDERDRPPPDRGRTRRCPLVYARRDPARSTVGEPVPRTRNPAAGRSSGHVHLTRLRVIQERFQRSHAGRTRLGRSRSSAHRVVNTSQRLRARLISTFRRRSPPVRLRGPNHRQVSLCRTPIADTDENHVTLVTLHVLQVLDEKRLVRRIREKLSQEGSCRRSNSTWFRMHPFEPR